MTSNKEQEAFELIDECNKNIESGLSKLAKKGLVRWQPSLKGYHGTGYRITSKGLETIKEYETEIKG